MNSTWKRIGDSIQVNAVFTTTPLRPLQKLNKSPHYAPMWTQKDGTKILIEDMKTSHIENSVKMLKRSNPKIGPSTAAKIRDLEAELVKRRIALVKELISE